MHGIQVMKTAVSDCCAEPGNQLLTVEQGRQRILEAISTVGAVEQLHLQAALDRVLAETVVSAIDVPPFSNSAMDGYALRSTDCGQADDCCLTVIGKCFAGAPFDGQVGPGQCVRIMTGAVIPDGADAVIMQERVKRDADIIRFADKPAAGENIRHVGEDSRQGDTVLTTGTRLGAAEIGLLASVGISEVKVRRPLRVAFFSTGDELTGLGSPLAPGQIYDSNRYTLFALLTRAGLQCHDLGVIADDRDAVRAAFRQAAGMADLILTSGGVSVGEADYITETLQELGEVNFWRMAMKPGKPLAFGRVQQAYFFGLPGNPVSVMATFYQFVLPAIRKMNGEAEHQPLLIPARAAETFRKAPGRMEFQRGVLRTDAQGDWMVSSTGGQGSHLLSSMSRANCFVLLAADSSGAEAGETVTVQPFCDFA
jgi:molybdopterin molybdotransferase